MRPGPGVGTGLGDKSRALRDCLLVRDNEGDSAVNYFPRSTHNYRDVSAFPHTQRGSNSNRWYGQITKSDAQMGRKLSHIQIRLEQGGRIQCGGAALWRTHRQQHTHTTIQFQDTRRMYLNQCFSTFVRPRPGKFLFHKTRTRSQQIYS